MPMDRSRAALACVHPTSIKGGGSKRLSFLKQQEAE